MLEPTVCCVEALPEDLGGVCAVCLPAPVDGCVLPLVLPEDLMGVCAVCFGGGCAVCLPAPVEGCVLPLVLPEDLIGVCAVFFGGAIATSSSSASISTSSAVKPKIVAGQINEPI